MEVIKAPKLSLLSKIHENKWVALSSNYEKILAIADSLRMLRDKIGEKKAIIMKVLPSDVGYAPRIHS